MPDDGGARLPRGGQTIAAEVVYARPEHQVRLRVQLPRGATVREAIESSGVLGACPEIRLAHQAVGVYGRIVSLEDEVRAGDRIEIYRPLRVDPKVRRRRKADAAR